MLILTPALMCFITVQPIIYVANTHRNQFAFSQYSKWRICAVLPLSSVSLFFLPVLYPLELIIPPSGKATGIS